MSRGNVPIFPLTVPVISDILSIYRKNIHKIYSRPDKRPMTQLKLDKPIKHNREDDHSPDLVGITYLISIDLEFNP
jgi:hypothetical protein